MKFTETIASKSGLRLIVDTLATEQTLELQIQLEPAGQCVLHWGMRRPQTPEWIRPPQETWPEGTVPQGNLAVQTPFDGGHQGQIRIHLHRPVDFSSLEFVLFFPDRRAWDNNGGKNYHIEFPGAAAGEDGFQQALTDETRSGKPLFQRIFETEAGRLAAIVTVAEERYVVSLLANISGPLLLHWGIARYSSYDWFLPPAEWRPPGTVLFQNTTQTPFTSGAAGVSRLRLEFPAANAPLGLPFVLKLSAAARWLNDRGGNFYVPITAAAPAATGVEAGRLAGIVDEIVQAEMQRNSWTLMHRFNLACDLLDRVRGDLDGLAILFVWLRFSAIRQLTWQRNYNTKPRELSHAQDRLTQRLAGLYHQEPAGRALVRLMLATVGRGGEGQRIRDEILNIMHRHHIKEVAGHFLEEWHQKLHNNTTPDDIVICEAYLEFLRSGGNLDRFYNRLERGGVTRQRLEGFERPIRTPPDFIPWLKQGLIPDFEQFLKILNSVHAGTDLETAAVNAQSVLDAEIRNKLWHLWHHRDDPQWPLLDCVQQITEIHRRLLPRLMGGHSVRELLYLDLALEQLLRRVIERNLHQRLSGDQLVELIRLVVENLALSPADGAQLFAGPELEIVLRHWIRLNAQPRFNREWSLHAKAVADRTGRLLSEGIDRTYRLLQPKAELLGSAFHADAWTITLFSEEVVRGSSLGFVLSQLLRRLDPFLRQAAQLGNWQVVSPGSGQGTVEVVESLRSVQGMTFDGPRVVVADHVAGDEELPEAVTAVIAPDVTDIVSHVAVRARNARLLFATCYDPQLLTRLKSLRGRQLDVQVTPAGDVAFTEIAAGGPSWRRAKAPAVRLRSVRPGFSQFVILEQEFNDRRVGAKSLNQKLLREKLPGWIHVPEAAAVPFGVFEEICNDEPNRPLASRCRQFVQQLEPEANPAKILQELRSTIAQLQSTEALASAFAQALAALHLAPIQHWDDVWSCLRRVWASKWNERAYFSRKTLGIAPDDLFMAVLIQPLVPAEYAFVIHTANPFTGNRDELFAEIVLGLGETLVGNHPGRAFSFVADKQTRQTRLLSYPSKSIGLYGNGLIFRSDSNAEDLAGYAGAGLYDSIPLRPPLEVALDYSKEPLIWNEAFQRDLLDKIIRLGLEVENVFGQPQDIEGAFARGQLFVVQTRPQVGLDHV